MHLATAAVVNAVWDLFAKRAGKPLWRLLVEYVARARRRPRRLPVHERRAHAREAVAMLERLADPGRPRRRAGTGRLSRLHDIGRLAGLRRCQDPPPVPRGADRRLVDVQAQGGRRRRGRHPAGADRARGDRPRPVSPSTRTSAGTWPEAIDWMARLARFDPYWIEEPTSPDDILGHATIARRVAPILVATGEHVQTGSCSSSSCRRRRSASARSTRAGSAGSTR